MPIPSDLPKQFDLSSHIVTIYQKTVIRVVEKDKPNDPIWEYNLQQNPRVQIKVEANKFKITDEVDPYTEPVLFIGIDLTPAASDIEIRKQQYDDGVQEEWSFIGTDDIRDDVFFYRLERGRIVVKIEPHNICRIECDPRIVLYDN